MASLTPSAELARKNTSSYPNESADYRAARNQLLTDEIELRRHIERVAEQRRALPLGGEIPEDYLFSGEKGPVRLSDLFGKHNTLYLYSYMFGPQRKKPCPMCTSLLDGYAGRVANIRERMGFAVVARSPIERLTAWKTTHDWPDMPLVSDIKGDFTRAYVDADDGDMPAMNVFVRRDGNIYHFWSAEMSDVMSDHGQDPRGHVDPDQLWHLLDLTPEGRGDWYPKLLRSE